MRQLCKGMSPPSKVHHDAAFYGYPITPASEIAGVRRPPHQKRAALFCRQSEVSAINMVYGAEFSRQSG